MFGKNKITQEDLDKVKVQLEAAKIIIAEFDDRKKGMDLDFEQVKKAREQMIEDIKNASENITNASDSAKANNDLVAELSHEVNVLKDRMTASGNNFEDICKRVDMQLEECEKIVDENKHFTTPSKFLTEYPASVRTQNASYVQHLNYMAEYGKQMSVLALNSAIEAGRIGESGIQFMKSAEEVRLMASKYEESAKYVKAEVEKSAEKIDELEDTVKKLVGLLKENNIAMAKLMKESAKTKQMIKDAEIPNYGREIEPFTDKLSTIRNSMEEVIKAEERNKLELEDLLEEINRQENLEQTVIDAIEDYSTLTKKEI